MDRSATRRLRVWAPLGCAVVLALASGCRTTVNLTDTDRPGTQQLLLASVIDATVYNINFHPIAGTSVFLDMSQVEVTGKDYLTYRLRERMSDYGIRLAAERDSADLVVECGAAALGTDSDERLLGITEADRLPDLILSRAHRQFGVAQIALFAYDRETGQPVWKSGPVRSDSSWQSRNVLGLGARYTGTIDHPANNAPRRGLFGRVSGVFDRRRRRR